MLRRAISRFTSNVPFLFYNLKKADLALHHFLGRQFEPDFLRFQKAARSFPNLNIVDVGGNIGQSAIGFARLFPSSRITSFEANPNLEGYLRFCRSLIGKRFSFQMLGLSERPGEVTLFIPKRGAVLIYGEAAIDRGALSDPSVAQRIGAFEVVQQNIRLVRFDDLGVEPDIVKIDVQGHELSVLRGMTQVISKFSPIFLLERSGADKAIMDLLVPMGYGFYVPQGDGPLVRYQDHFESVNMFALPEATATRKGLLEAILR